MPVYHQIGNDSQNLVQEPYLWSYRGAILSPVNYNRRETSEQVSSWKQTEGFDTVFDPQFYVPASMRGTLPTWDYFPSDFDTADQSSPAWWMRVIERLVQTSAELGVSSACSPAVVPRTFDDEYFQSLVAQGDEFERCLSGTQISALQTAVVNLPDLAAQGRPLTIASILSRSRANRVYLAFCNGPAPRREMKNTQELKGAMRLIAELEAADMRVLVGFCSSDLILWKTARASACATGKFFNLRRFTLSRWENESAQGGGLLPYWFEESLFAFLRESDLARLLRQQTISQNGRSNPYGEQILRSIQNTPGAPWVKLSWCFFLYWFSNFSQRLEEGLSDPEKLLGLAEEAWTKAPLFDEVPNSGDWIRPWRIAVREYLQD